MAVSPLCSVPAWIPPQLTRLSCRPPPVDIQSTDDLLVHAYNSLDQPMTLHHHGMFFNSTSWMDGAVGITQW